MSKGSGRRPAAVSAVESERNWARTFGNDDSKRCKGAPAPRNAEDKESGGSGTASPQDGSVPMGSLVWAERYDPMRWCEPVSPTEGA